jgi:hypothetical protein
MAMLLPLISCYLLVGYLMTLSIATLNSTEMMDVRRRMI